MDSMSKTVAVFHASQYGLENNHTGANYSVASKIEGYQVSGSGSPCEERKERMFIQRNIDVSEYMKITVNSFKAKFYCR